MKVELLTGWEAIGKIAARWDELANEDPRDGFFRTWGWYRAWMEHIRPDAKPFILVIRENGGKIVGLAPFCQFSYRNLGFSLKGISWAGREVVSADFLDFISESKVRPQVLTAILEFLWKARSHWSLLIFGELIEGGDSYRELANIGQQRSLPRRVQEERICPYIDLPQTFDQYLATLGNSTRYNIRRRTREVLEKKGARIDVYSLPQQVLPHLDTLTRLHLARWNKDNLPGTLGRPGFAEFLKQICSSPPAGSSVRLYLLTYRDSPVAALLAFYFGESALYYQAGWDPDSPLASNSPAVVLMAHSIRDAIEHKLRYYEFLRGNEAYKLRWTKSYRKTVTLLLARNFQAKSYLQVAHLKDRIKHLLAKKSIAAPREVSPEPPNELKTTDFSISIAD
jgi:CelD/BcsL family acetyltransferase involved in cellulose biosynthesis